MKKIMSARLKALQGAMTQRDFAEKLDFPLNTYTNYLRGVSSPSIEAVKIICTRFGVSSDWLLGLSDTRTGHVESKTIAQTTSGQAPPACASCAAKDATIAQLSATISALSESLKQLAGAVAEKKSHRQPAQSTVIA